MKSRYCVECEETLYGDDADRLGDFLDDGFVCKACQRQADYGQDD